MAEKPVKEKPEPTVPPMPDEPGGGGAKPAKPEPVRKGGEEEAEE
jgi:hypothetical protein